MSFAWMFALVAQAAEVAPAARAQVAPEVTPTSERCQIVVLNLVGQSLSQADVSLPAIMTETLAGEVGLVSGCSVVSQADIVAMLAYEKQKAICSDDSDSCLAEIGQALGAERVIAGTVSKLGAEYLVSARLMNVKQGAVEQRAEEPAGVKPELLRTAAKNAARRLFGAPLLIVEEQPTTARPSSERGTVRSSSSSSSSSSSDALFWIGGATAGAGVAAAVVGAGITFVAENRLQDPRDLDKDSAVSGGRVGVSVAAVGAVVTLIGGICIGVSLLE